MGCPISTSREISIVRGSLFSTNLALGFESDYTYDLGKFRIPTISKVSRWYINFWLSRLDEGKIPVQITLQCCRALQSVLDATNPLQITDQDSNLLHWLCKEVHEYFAGAFCPDTLFDEGDGCAPNAGVAISISSVISTFNSLAQSHNVSSNNSCTFVNVPEQREVSFFRVFEACIVS